MNTDLWDQFTSVEDQFRYEYNDLEQFSGDPLAGNLVISNGYHDQIQGRKFNSSSDHVLPSVSNLSLLPAVASANATTNISDDHPSEEEEVEGDYFDGVFKYIQQILMEEEEEKLENRPCMLQDCLALQAAEKIFDHVLHHEEERERDGEEPSCSSSSSHCRSPTPAFIGQYFDNPADDFADIWNNLETSSSGNHLVQNQEPDLSYSCITNVVHHVSCENTLLKSNFLQNKKISGMETSNQRKNTHFRNENENDNNENQCSSKQFASYNQEIEETDVYDDALLCPDKNPNFYGESPPPHPPPADNNQIETNSKTKFEPQKPKRGRPRSGTKRSMMEIIDLRDLLTRCAQSVANYDNVTATELLKKIRQHCSIRASSGTQRLAHFFANALEARISGTGSAIYTSMANRTASASEILKAYEPYIKICPFQRMSNIFANKTIAFSTNSATRIHIIDIGILYGFQWPCIIHGISLRPGGPPMLKITGIDLPQPGFRPRQRIEETGRRLASFCKRFNVPFEFNAIAKRWDAIKLDELKINNDHKHQDDEMVVVNCLYRLRNVPDETVTEKNPRDGVMDLIKKINPDLFIHGILNAGYNAPFFATRFKEAMHHFSAMFDLFEATLPPEDEERGVFEKEILGRDIMNVIACEGFERVDRPDTYKQWQTRNQRAGFRQVGLNQKIMKEIKVKVRSSYHKEFLVDEDSNWMLQGWKGRVIYAISCWKPSKPVV